MSNSDLSWYDEICILICKFLEKHCWEQEIIEGITCYKCLICEVRYARPYYEYGTTIRLIPGVMSSLDIGTCKEEITRRILND